MKQRAIYIIVSNLVNFLRILKILLSAESLYHFPLDKGEPQGSSGSPVPPALLTFLKSEAVEKSVKKILKPFNHKLGLPQALHIMKPNPKNYQLFG